ncbi:ABC transporter substrate-binding protein [Klebsiella pneumoniae]|uniref:ABC transporter substrate-binding protein n=1 Tax=Klebsiella pneumoniae TaxID=573 RepID=A0A378C2N5_KLEPN|nr:ABC transporter substrate-binding protein [Klebsiella pneumoniae]
MEIALNPHARFHDGTPITARDVVFTFNKFMTGRGAAVSPVL